MSTWEKQKRMDTEDLLGSVARAGRAALAAAHTFIHQLQLLKPKVSREFLLIYLF